MSPATERTPDKSRLAVLLQHFATIEDPRDVRRILHPLSEVLLLVVCASIADCDDYDHIAAWGEAHLDFLRRHLPYQHGVPGGRWLTILMNRINPALFSAAFTALERATWPDRPEFVAIDGKKQTTSSDPHLNRGVNWIRGPAAARQESSPSRACRGGSGEGDRAALTPGRNRSPGAASAFLPPTRE